MKILAIGDPHGKLPKNIPKKFDFCIITGDLGKANLARKRFFENQKRKQNDLPGLEETETYTKEVYNEIHYSTISVLKFLSKFAPVYTIQGNVGIFKKSESKEIKKKWKINLFSTREKIKSIKNVNLIKNQFRIINGLKIGFLEFFTDTSWVKEFRPMDYSKKMKSAKKQTDKAKKILSRFKGLDILVCHQPPYGILDKVNFPGIPKNWIGKHAGSKAILNYIKTYQPKIVLCGHIHEAKGKAKIRKTVVYNLGCCGDYKILKI
ncbi:MAG: metallophosphoesterase [Nanoarchaeota archaeon]|nr:metallophosphoesterase [Nanoarchaeota archaeon]